MNRIYIIGSISQSAEICKLAKKLKRKNNEVRYVKLSALSFKQTVKECFKNILWCNELIVIPKINPTAINRTTIIKVPVSIFYSSLSLFIYYYIIICI